MSMRHRRGEREGAFWEVPFQSSPNTPVGRLLVELSPPFRWAVLRDGLRVPVPFTATFTPEPMDDVPATDLPAVEIKVDEHSGVLIVAEVLFTAQSANRPIRSAMLRAYSLERLVQLAATQVAAPPRDYLGRSPQDMPTDAWVAESIVAATRARTSVDRQRLDEVAELYAAGRVRAVEAALHISRSQAYRLIKLAREQGHIKEDNR